MKGINKQYERTISKRFKCEICGAECTYGDILDYIADTQKPEFSEMQRFGDYSLALKYGCLEIRRGKRCAGKLKEMNTESPP